MSKNGLQVAFICDAQRTPFGRYGGSLSSVRTDDLAAAPIRSLIQRNPGVNWEQLEEVMLGCANQAGEDNRNVARMASLLAGLPVSAAAVTLNRLCGSGLDAIGSAARAIKLGESALTIAGGVESMSRAPFVMPKAASAFSRDNAVYDTTIGWRFVNPLLAEQYGTHSMPETAENVAERYAISREDQDNMALASQRKALAAQQSGFFSHEIVPIEIPRRRAEPLIVEHDEHPRDTSLESLAKLRPIVRPGGTITAGNASGVNDGACAVLMASESMAVSNNLTPRARIVGMSTAGVEPSVMGIGPVPAVQRLLSRLKFTTDDLDVIELNEAFAAQGLAVLRELGIDDNDPRVNPNGGARLVTTAINQLHQAGGRYALCTMCVGVGQGIALILEKM